LQESPGLPKGSEDALNRGLYDVSGVLAQISAELAIKATISFLGYSFPETHEIRRLLGVLSSITLKDEVQNFVKSGGRVDSLGKRQDQGTVPILQP